MSIVYGISYHNVHLNTVYNANGEYGSGEIAYTF